MYVTHMRLRVGGLGYDGGVFGCVARGALGRAKSSLIVPNKDLNDFARKQLSDKMAGRIGRNRG
jgi:hypothetical protein